MAEPETPETQAPQGEGRSPSWGYQVTAGHHHYIRAARRAQRRLEN